jgi:hypothetical protein
LKEDSSDEFDVDLINCGIIRRVGVGGALKGLDQIENRVEIWEGEPVESV